jgi:hypothetical protein
LFAEIDLATGFHPVALRFYESNLRAEYVGLSFLEDCSSHFTFASDSSFCNRDCRRNASQRFGAERLGSTQSAGQKS